MILVKLLASQILFIVFGGFGHALLYRQNKSHIPFWEKWSVIYLLGLGSLGFCLFLVGLLRIQLASGVIVILACLAGLGWFLLSCPNIKTFVRIPRHLIACLHDLREKVRTWSLVEIILILGIGGIIFLQFQYTFGLPLMGFDSRAHWALKSKILHYEKTFYSESFYDSERIHPQVRHPLLIPLMQVVVTRMLGVYDDRLMKLPFFLLFLSLILFFYSELRRYYNRMTALFFVLFLGTLPLLSSPMDGGITSGYVDAPMALYILCTMIFLVRWLEQGSFVHLSFAALFAIFTMYMKDDGIGFVASGIGALLFSLLIFKTTSWKKRLLSLILFIVMVLLFLVPAKIYSYSLSVGKGEYFESILKLDSIRKNIGRLPQILSSYELEMLLNLPHWGILWILLIFSIVYNVKRFRIQEVLFVGLTLLFYLCVLTVVFIVLPWDLAQFFAGSLGRLILHMSPAAVYFIALLWKERISGEGGPSKIPD